MVLSRFLLRTLCWLPVCFGVWYYLASLLILPVTLLLNLTLPALWPDALTTLEQQGHSLDVVTRLTLAEAGIASPDGRPGLVVFSVNPLAYAYCLPLLAALTLAAPGPGRDNRLLLGVAALLPVVALGVATAILKSLAFDLGPAGPARLGLGGWGLEAVALAYQFGYLILPAIAPVILWLLLHRGFVSQLAPRLYARPP